MHQPPEPTDDPSLQGEGAGPGQNTGTSLTYELYDLYEDPAETKDLSHALPEMAKELETELNRWRQSVAGSIQKMEREL